MPRVEKNSSLANCEFEFLENNRLARISKLARSCWLSPDDDRERAYVNCACAEMQRLRNFQRNFSPSPYPVNSR